jgi:hypothetical protein
LQRFYFLLSLGVAGARAAFPYLHEYKRPDKPDDGNYDQHLYDRKTLPERESNFCQ